MFFHCRIKVNINYVSSFQAVGHLNIFSLNYFFRVRFSMAVITLFPNCNLIKKLILLD